MTDVRPLSLDQKWKEQLGLANRRSPELYESAEVVTDTPHALAIRAALDDIGLSAVFCVQGAPTIAILSVERYDRNLVIDLHGELWNQGLASLLMVIAEDTLRAFSLARKPFKELGDEFERRCLIDTLNTTAHALEFRNLVYGAESGRLWKEYADYFKPKERIDQVLLDNLKDSHQLLQDLKLSSDEAQALLIQTMFIAYLEDREILTPEYFREASRNAVDSFSSLLATRNVRLLRSLFTKLRNHFNGDLFVAPCSFEPHSKTPELADNHIDILARFREGREEIAKGRQLRFWGYNFRYIPIELVSAVYDRFLGEKEEQRREQGAYYTPMFLADTVVSQVWEELPSEVREKGRYLDPACGSGVFLVRSFQRLCEHWRATRTSRTIRWDSLLAILQRVHGWDLNGSAVRVAVFSLYVALLEEVSPPDIRRLFDRGKILPELWDKTLVCKDFFEAPENEFSFDVIVGNPPWSSRRGVNRSSVRWCKKNRIPMPGGEDAWAFVWKALRHVSDDGTIAFLLPAMGFLHNNADNTVSARNRFIQESRIRRIINFADLRFQLFEGANRPAALIIFGKSRVTEGSYRFDYWVPKADLNLQIKRLITLSSADKFFLSAERAAENPLAFKQRLWMREPDAKLFNYLARLPTLGGLIKDYGGMRRRRRDVAERWVIGQGFQPLNDHVGRRKSSSYSVSQYVGVLPDLPIAAYQRLAQPVSALVPWPSRRVRRKGFEAGFTGPRILVPRGVETSQMRLRATYTEDDLTFQHILQAITVPPAEKPRAKLLAALLNSRVAIWFAFHGTSSFGSERPEVKQVELLRLPFPAAADLPDPERADDAANKLVAIVDDAIRVAKVPFGLESEEDSILGKIDHLAYQYFCLSDDEIILIEDAIDKTIPAVQPHEGNYPDVWKVPTEKDRRAYATTLVAGIGNWLRNRGQVSARLEASSADLGILRLTMDGAPAGYSESRDNSLADVFSRISEHIRQPLDGNFQLMPDLRVFFGRDLYLIKPMQQRFWLRSAALADADAIAMDLQDTMELGRRSRV
jgi:N-6 DNA methylase